MDLTYLKISYYIGIILPYSIQGIKYEKVINHYLCYFNNAFNGLCHNSSASPQEKAFALVQSMRTNTWHKLYAEKPSVKQQIANSAGYAVFDNANVNVVLASFGGGYGVVKNNLTGQSTYMNMGEAGLGLGLGVKDFNVVMVFHNQSALNRFMNMAGPLVVTLMAQVKIKVEH